MRLHSARAIETMLMKTGTPAVDPWFSFRRRNPNARLRLFCFPYAGGGALIYRNWAENLPPMVELMPVELPGRGGQMMEPAFTHLPQLIESLAHALEPYLNMPFALFGHSMGAVISFELARFLRREHKRMPLHLFISGRRAPAVPETDPPVYQLPEDQFLEELQRLNGTPAEVLENTELIKLLIPLLRADFELIQTYAYTADSPLDCGITAFGGLEDNEAVREDMEPWRDETTSDFRIHMLPGDHFFLRGAEGLLIRLLTQDLHRILSRSSE